MINLRPHQTIARDNALAGWNSGKLSQLVVLPPGGGKTEVGLGTFKSELESGALTRALWLCHTKELVTQPRDRVLRNWPQLNDCGIVRGAQNENDHALTFATRQTMAKPKRMSDLLSHGPMSHLLIDEAHHAPSVQYKAIVSMAREANPDLRILGITATPTRADGKGMIEVFDEVALALELMDLVPQWLCPPLGKAIKTGISLAAASTYVNAEGDTVFSKQSFSAIFETDNCLDLVVHSHKKWAEGRKGIAFTATVKSAHRLAKAFNKAGIRAVAVEGKTNRRERDAIIADARAGRYDVLVNCKLLTEGFDWPEASVVHIVKKVRTPAPYLQMMGRALRLWPGKTDGLILDYVGLENDLAIGLEDVLGNVKIKPHREPVERGEVAAAVQFEQGELAWAMGDVKLLQAKTIEFFSASRWSWYRHSDGWASIGLGAGKLDKIQRALILSPPDDNGEFKLYFTWKRHDERKWSAAPGAQGAFESVQAWADDMCIRRGDKTLADKGKTWRSRGVSDGQRRWFGNHGIDPSGLNRGGASDMITHVICKEALGRKGVY